jgi:outer membrane receptor for ferrienterochelin and colicins
LYAGVKNLLNWTPNREILYHSKTNDPFDKMFNMIPPEMHKTPDNPYALTFDPGYVYGPNQGVRSFLGDIH